MLLTMQTVAFHSKIGTHLNVVLSEFPFRIKAEKEQTRLEEERRLERLRQLEEDRLEMAEREFLILERLRLEEEERAEVLEKKERAKKDKEATR